MSVVLLEGSHNRSSLYSEAQRRQLVAGFEAVVSNKLTVERNLASNPPKNGSYSELVGVSMVFIYDRDPRLQRGRVTIEPVIDSDLGYRFEPNGVQGVKRTLLDLTDRKNIEEIYSRMVSVDIADALVGLIRAPWLDPAIVAQRAIALDQAEQTLIQARGLRVQLPKE